MAHSYEGTTLALQHYYDIIGAPKTQPLLTIYPANEHPFGNRMSVWMAAYSDNINLPETTKRRLDDAMLKNRAVADPHVLRVLDYGSSEGNSFVVTDAIHSVTLRQWLRSRGPLQTWQALRLLDQLTGVVTSSHNAGFRELCLSSDNIFIRDEDRFDILTGPLGIGLHRAEILELRDITISTDMMRHIPPWEFAIRPASRNDADAFLSRSMSSTLLLDEFDAQPDDDLAEIPDGIHISEPESSGQDNPDPSEASKEPDDHIGLSEQTADAPREDSIQDLDSAAAAIDHSIEIPAAPANACPDVYALAAILYEALCGQHPYFADTGELCSAALSIIQANPPELSSRVEISDEMSAVVMTALRNPKKDSAPQFLTDFAACCTESDREKSRQAEKSWLTPTPTAAPGKRARRIAPRIRHPFGLAGIAAVILVIATAFVTWQIAQLKNPIDLFALPEIVPMAQDGVDVVIAPRTAAPNATLYLVSLADGTPIRLGGLPYIYRKQEDNAKLTFLIADEDGHAMQLPVTVKGEDGMMFVPVEINW